MPRSPYFLSSLALLAAGASGCAFSIDPDLISSLDAGGALPPEDAAGEPPEAGGFDAGEAQDAAEEPDAGEERDAGMSSQAAGGDAAQIDAAQGAMSTMGTDGAVSTACGADPACGSDRICVAASCVPRCDDATGCAVAVIPASGTATWEGINDGKQTVYYFYEDFGDARDDNVLWKYRRGMQPVELGHDPSPRAKPLFVANDYVFYLSNAQLPQPDLYRISVRGSTPELVADKVLGAWRTLDNVWWTKQVEGSCRLWSSPAEGPFRPAQLPAMSSALNCGWSAGSDKWVVRSLTPPRPGTAMVTEALVVDFLPDLGGAKILATIQAPRLIGADDEAVYVHTDGQYMRYWEDPTYRGVLTSPPLRMAPRTADALEVSLWGWGYWRANDADGPSLGRMHRDNVSFQTNELLRLPYTAKIDGFTALPTALVYVSGGRLYEKETPLPCSTGTPCPDGFSCQGSCR